MHVHVLIGNSRFILDLLASGGVTLSSRHDARKPKNAKKSDERRALKLAEANHLTLMNLCQKVHKKRTAAKEGEDEKSG